MNDAVVQIEGRTLKLSNLEKPMFPEVGFTKAHVIDYYRRIAPALLPHLEGRPVTLKRYPDGVDGEFFYEKECPSHAPEWVRTVDVYSETRQGPIHFCVIDDLPTLVWAANLADLEMHTYLARGNDPLAPTMMVFDLDPGPGTDVTDCAAVGLRLRDMLEDLHLESFFKTSGSKGAQLYVPLNTPANYDDTKAFARALGEILERETPRTVTTNMRKSEREGRVFVDWSQNDDHKTTVCVYSLRARAEPTVSTPLTWAEVRRIAESGDPSLARFLPEEALARVAERGDLFAPVLTLQQSLPVLT